MPAHKSADPPTKASAERTKTLTRVMYATATIITTAALAVGLAAAGDRTPPASTPAAPGTPTATGGAATHPEARLPETGGPKIEAHGHDHGHRAGRYYTPGPAAPAAPQALAVIAAFAAAWAQPGADAGTWWHTIAALCEPGFADRLATTDPARIPATAITGDPHPSVSRTDLVTAEVATDTGTLSVTAALIDGQWLIVGNDYARTLS